MSLINTIILLITGFVAFFATGIDDTVAYAGLYLNNNGKFHKILISLGIIIGTFIALAIAIFAGSAMESLPSRHLIGGFVLISLGIFMFFRGKWSKHTKTTHLSKVKKHIKQSRTPKFKNLKFVGLGTTLFFATAIDDMIAYSNLIMAKGSWMAICAGVLIATFVALIIAYFLSGKLKRFPHPEKIGAVIMIIVGILLALKIL